jgi:murein DD-endopeptidase MepM/ murein hydrolase activator NlpD
VKDAGPVSGFGQWVRLEHADGTITVYGHVDSYSVRTGQRVQAGQQIARMGNRGESTGPHLHFEVWNPAGQKINPLPWLNNRGVTV